MGSDSAITVRLPRDLKQRIERRAKREHRSLSAQVVYELEQALAQAPTMAPGKLLGRYAGMRVPTDEEIREVRDTLWRRLARHDG